MSPDDISELFRVFGAVDVRRMFGGAGIFADDMMIGLVHDGVIYLKCDEQTEPAFERESLGPFTYRRKGKLASLNYRRMPDRLYDDPDELAAWAREALGAARRHRAKSKRPGGRKSAARAKRSR